MYRRTTTEFSRRCAIVVNTLTFHKKYHLLRSEFIKAIEEAGTFENLPRNGKK